VFERDAGLKRITRPTIKTGLKREQGER